jgi:hypothetical protein
MGDFRQEKGDSKPNLFSFIGFDEGSNPTNEIEKRLDPRHPDGPKMIYRGRNPDSLEFRYEIRAPDKEAIYEATPIPWLKGRHSWAQRVEKGIPGVGHSLNKIMPNGGRGNGSASGGGVQVEGELREASFRSVKYLSKMFDAFLSKVPKRIRSGRKVI